MPNLHVIIGLLGIFVIMINLLFQSFLKLSRKQAFWVNVSYSFLSLILLIQIAEIDFIIFVFSLFILVAIIILFMKRIWTE